MEEELRIKIEMRLAMLKEELNHLDNPDVWKPVIGYEDSYLVSKLGQVYSIIGKRLLTIRYLKGGKAYLTLNRNGARSTLQPSVVRDATWLPPSQKVTVLSGKRIGSLLSPDEVIAEAYSAAKKNVNTTVTIKLKKKTDEA